MEVFTDSLQIESELGFGTKVTMIKYYGKSWRSWSIIKKIWWDY
jgi:hypothetical protein